MRPHRSPTREPESKSKRREDKREERKSSEPQGFFVRPHSPHERRGVEGERERSFFGLNVDRGSPTRSTYSTTSRGFTSWLGGAGRHSSGSSYYKRRPRDGYVQRLMHQIRRLWRNLLRYAKENPFKLFMLVIMPLVTGGALHQVLSSMGVRLPPGIAKFMGGGRDGPAGARPAGGAGGSGIDIGQVMNVAKMFM